MQELITKKIEHLKEELEAVNDSIEGFEELDTITSRHWAKQAKNKRIGIIHTLRVLMEIKTQFLTTKEDTLKKEISTPKEETELEYHDRIHKEKQAKRDNYYG